MKELMKKLVQEYVRPVPLLIMALCVYAGYLIASDQDTLSNNFFWLILAGVVAGVLFSYGYIEKKYQIFLWAFVGTAIASATTLVQGENQVLISNLFQDAFWGAFVGLLVEQSPRGVTIGAMIMGVFFGGLAFWTFYFSSGNVFISGIKVENGILASGMSVVFGAWKGALYGGIIGSSWSDYKKGKQKTKSRIA
jgi:hypothetical protein